MSEITNKNSVVTKTVEKWRNWLAKHHNKKAYIWQIKYKKHTGKTAPTHRDSMDEAICFGWIDTIIRRLDLDRYAVKFVKRNKNSRWSKATIRHAKRLIKEKRMTPAGLEEYKKGLKKPLHDRNLPKNPKAPEDLKIALAKNKKAQENFESLAPSYRKRYLYLIISAKRPETRKKRIREVVRRSLQNKKPGE